MGKIALVFSGQGAQYPGMGSELYEASPAAAKIFDMADAVRPGTSRQCFFGSKDELAKTENTQPCVFSAGLAAAQALAERGIYADMTAGFSLGELPALAYSGILCKEAAFKLVCRRAELMQAAADKADGGMLAVLGLPDDAVKELCQKHYGVYPANYNCPGQLVVSGLKSALESFAADVAAGGGRALPLRVGGGFHSPLMREATDRLESELCGYEFSAPRIPVYSNVTARPYEKNIKTLLAAQASSPVLWKATIENMARAGAEIFIETGPGKTLCGLISKTLPGARVFCIENIEGLERLVAACPKG